MASIKTLSLLVLSIGIFSAMNLYGFSVNVNNVSATDLRDADGNPVGNGTLGLLLIDTGSDGITFEPEVSIQTGLLGASNDYLAKTVGSQTIGTESVTFGDSIVDDDSLASGQKFYVAWFPSLTTSSSVIGFSEPYGLASKTEWILPSDGGTIVAGAVTGGSASLTTAIPEPSSYATVAGLLGLAYAVSRRRRRSSSLARD